MQETSRRTFLRMSFSGLAASSLLSGGAACAKSKSPNIVLIFCDDMGYGDIGCFGSTKHRTPNVDRMAAEGMRLTSFYVTSGVCTPSRSSLMTGCYPRIVGLNENSEGKAVLFPVAKKGLNPKEVTMAEVLKSQGYATACIGKWHLGDQTEFLPTRQGFDYYYGIPYSNDMGKRQRNRNNPPLPLMRNEKVIEAPVDQTTVTKRYTEETLKFMKSNRGKPFFIYLPHAMPHLPLFSSDRFSGKSANGAYGDAIEEIDWSTGQILDALKGLGLDDNTLVIFTSDNGARRAKDSLGSNAPLSGGKGTTMEGGMRVPCVVRWPGNVPAGRSCDELCSTIDLLPTFAGLAGTTPPSDRHIDGKDIWPLLAGEEGAKSPHDAFYYYFMEQLHAVRSGKWKLILPLEVKKTGWNRDEGKCELALYDLDKDIGETTDVSAKHPEEVERLLKYAERAREGIGDSGRKGKHQRTAGFVVTPEPLLLSGD